MPSRLNIVYKGESSDLIYIAHYDGTTWSGNKPINVQNTVLNPIESNVGPTGTNFDGSYIIYKGAGSDVVYQSHLSDNVWTGNIPVVVKDPNAKNPVLVSTVKSNYAPGAAVFKNCLYIIYKVDYANDLCVSFLDNWGDWHENALIRNFRGTTISPKSNYCPSAAVINGLLLIIYKGESSNTLYTASFNGDTWTGDTPIAEQPGGISPESNYTPSAVFFDGMVYIIYKGAHSNNLYYAWFNGARWAGNLLIETADNGAPKSDQTTGAAVFGGKLVICYKSQDSNDLFTASFDGKSWTGNTSIESQITPEGSISPKSNYGPGMFVD